MTAYGRATDIINGKEILVEIKSVNSRYLDCTVKISRLYSYLEERAKAYLSAKGITRGKIDLYIACPASATRIGSHSLHQCGALCCVYRLESTLYRA